MANLKKLIIRSMAAAALTATMALATACSAPKKVVYLPDAEQLPAEVLRQSQTVADPVLAPGDLLNIRVMSSDIQAVAPFNRDMFVNPDGSVTISSNNSSNTSKEAMTNYYLVSNAGTIDFPIIGSIDVAGKTKSEVAQIIRSNIYPKYVKVEPTVEVRLMNFRVTVLGAVKNPGQFSVSNERVNLLEAIAMAGDLDIRGERENILLYRTNADGTREVHRLNLNDRNTLLSPYFNLYQNDIIYVQPNESARQGAWQMHQGWTTALSVVGGASAVAALIVSIINISK